MVNQRTPAIQEDSFLRGGMATSIGACCAAFTLLVLEKGTEARPGVYYLESWAELEALFKVIEKLDCPRDQIIESVSA